MSNIVNVPVDVLQVIVKLVEETEKNIRNMTGIRVDLLINLPKGSDMIVEAGWLKLRQLICRYSGLNWSDIIVSDRSTELVLLRAAYCYMGRQTIGSRSLNQIGKDIGNRHHTTVMHLTSMFADMLETGNTPSLSIYTFIKSNFTHETKNNEAAV